MSVIPPDDRIAIVGMACRVPGADDLDTFWRNLVDGVDSIETLSDQDLHAAGVPESLWRDPRYIRAGGFVADVDRLDAALFNCTPREAALLDPQHRLLMECAWHALEHAGHGDLGREARRAGVYAGVANSAYYHARSKPSLDVGDSAGMYQALIAGERDFATTRLSYFFDLSGPSVNVQSACSTSLVAVHLACQALLAGECDVALAGGAAVRLPQRVGYLYEEGMILSRDGRCRPFDADASGTVIGNGAGMVVLRRLEDALADGDTVHAAILGSAVNNDGSQKAGYTAPSVEGQAGVVLEALTLAGVSADSIGYVEAHGTGTAIGDPIEVTALTEAFRHSTSARGFCALGSVKSNVGHLDIAAGVVGLIKAVLAVSHGVVPPSLHFRRANPALALESTPFFVPQAAVPWPGASPRRAGVSAFGIGGTNAHIVIEAVADERGAVTSRQWEVLCLSAKTPTAMRAIASALAQRLADDGAALPDLAFTLAVGRRALEHRHAIVCVDAADAIDQLRAVAESRSSPAVVARSSVIDAGDEAHALAQDVAARWATGAAIDWSAYYAGERRRRPLPLYPFERARHWIDVPAAEAASAVSRPTASSPGVFRPTWIRGPRLPRPAPLSGQWLLVGDVLDLAIPLAERLSALGAAVTVSDPDTRDLRGVILQSGARRIVHLGPSYESFVALGQAIVSAGNAAEEGAMVFAVTEALHAVTGDEQVSAGKSLLLGPLRVLPQEHPEIGCRNIDVGGVVSAEIVELLLAECLADKAPATVAIRGPHRWCTAVESVDLPTAPMLRPAHAPVYLIIGGLGRIGLALAQHLHDVEGAKLVLVGRTQIPAPSEWQAADDDVVTFDIDDAEAPGEDPLVGTLHALDELRRAGADFLCVSADVSREGELRRAFVAAEAAFGRVDVAVHAAAAPVAETFTAFEELAPGIARRHFAPKIDGVNALRAIAHEVPLRACVLMSSLASVLGGLGFAAYAAANAYLDAVAQGEDGVNGVRWLSLGWDAWQSPEQLFRSTMSDALAQSAITPADGVATFSRVLAADVGPHLLISSTDLTRWVDKLARPQPTEGQGPDFDVPPPEQAVARRTDDVVAATWVELLGVEGIGPDDDFYELGGNSLLATQVAARLRRAFGIELSVRVLFEETTVAALANHIDTVARVKPADRSGLRS